MVSAGYVGGTLGSGIVFSVRIHNVLWISVVRGMRGVGGVCVWLGVVWVERGVRGLGFGFTNSVGTGGMAAWPACPQRTVNRAPIAGGGRVRHNLHSSL